MRIWVKRVLLYSIGLYVVMWFVVHIRMMTTRVDDTTKRHDSLDHVRGDPSNVNSGVIANGRGDMANVKEPANVHDDSWVPVKEPANVHPDSWVPVTEPANVHDDWSQVIAERLYVYAAHNDPRRNSVAVVIFVSHAQKNLPVTCALWNKDEPAAPLARQVKEKLLHRTTVEYVLLSLYCIAGTARLS